MIFMVQAFHRRHGLRKVVYGNQPSLLKDMFGKGASDSRYPVRKIFWEGHVR